MTPDDVILGRLYCDADLTDGYVSLAPAFAAADRIHQIDVLRDWVELLKAECDRLLADDNAKGRYGTHRKPT